MSENESSVIRNTTVYNREIIGEFAKALRFSGFKRIAIVSAAMLVIGIALSIGTEPLYGYAFIAGTLIGLAAYFALASVRKKKIEKRILSQIKTAHHTEEINYEMEIDSKKIRLRKQDTVNEIFHEDLKKIRETDDLFMLFYNGGLFLLVSKNGFTSGSAGQFREMLGK